MMFRVRLMDGVKLGDVLFESRDRLECIRYIRDYASKYFSATELSFTEARVSIYTYNFDDPFRPKLLSDYKTYKAAKAAVLAPVRNWEDGYKFWWVYDEVHQNVMLCNEDGEMSCAYLYRDWFEKEEPINTYLVPRVKEAFLYEITEEDIAKLEKTTIKKTVKRMQLVHPSFMTAKKSTSREEFNKEFFAYMQREDC